MKTSQERKAWMIGSAIVLALVILAALLWPKEEKETIVEDVVSPAIVAQANFNEAYKPFPEDYGKFFGTVFSKNLIGEEEFNFIKPSIGSMLTLYMKNASGKIDTLSGKVEKPGALLGKYGKVYSVNGTIERSDILFNQQIVKLRAKEFPSAMSADSATRFVHKFELSVMLYDKEGYDRLKSGVPSKEVYGELIPNREGWYQLWEPGSGQVAVFCKEDKPSYYIESVESKGDLFLLKQDLQEDERGTRKDRKESMADRGETYSESARAFPSLGM